MPGGTWRDNPEKIILFDNGAYNIKYGTASTNWVPDTMFNAIGKDRSTLSLFVGNDVLEKLNKGQTNLSLTFPLVRGLLHDSDIEAMIWKKIFSSFGKKKFDEKSSCFWLTTPPVLPDIVLERYGEMVFEDFGFDAFFKTSGQSMLWEFAKDYFQEEGIDDEWQLILDSGFSFTYAVPIFGGMPIKHACTRIDIGGKLLTNLLNEIISYKEYNLTGETLLVNDIKEQLWYVSNEFNTDLEKWRLKDPDTLKEYVLPDYSTTTQGYKRDFDPNRVSNEQIITMGNSRFTVPEALFNPNNINIHQAGIPEMISQCINKCPEAMENLLYRNIILTGGNANFTGFAERIDHEILGGEDSSHPQGLKPDSADLRIFLSPNPELNTWNGLQMFAQRGDFEDYVVTKQEYEDEGLRAFRRFNL